MFSFCGRKLCGVLIVVIVVILTALAFTPEAHAQTGPAINISFNHDGSGPPTHFNVEMRESGGPWTEIAEVPWGAGVTSYQMLPYAVSPGDNLEVRVNAENASGVSLWAGPVAKQIPTTPSAPNGLSVITITITVN